jgi:hypothetical protein
VALLALSALALAKAPLPNPVRICLHLETRISVEIRRIVASVSLLLLRPIARLSSVSRLSSVYRRCVILLLLLLKETWMAIRRESLLSKTGLEMPV